MCRVEILLMSRGVPELLSHFRTDSYLVKEHRTRLETPGVPLCDRSEKALTGNALQEAKRVAKETYPIAPQLDACRLIVGQDRLLDFSITSNPSEDVISQIGILKYGLRHGGNGTYSLSFQSNQFETHIFLRFWAGNVFYQICLETGPRGTLIPKKMIGLIASFLSLFESHPSCFCLVDCQDGLLNSCFQTSLPGRLRPTSVNGFCPNELKRCLFLPTPWILEKHDYRTKLDFLLMKLGLRWTETGGNRFQLATRYNFLYNKSNKYDSRFKNHVFL